MGDRDSSRGETSAHAKPVQRLGVVIERIHNGTSVATENVNSEEEAGGRKRRGARESTETSTSHRETKTLQSRAKTNERAPRADKRDIKLRHGSNKTSIGGTQACQVGPTPSEIQRYLKEEAHRAGQKGHIASQKSSTTAREADKAVLYYDVSLRGKIEPHQSAEVACSETCPSDWIVCDVYKSSRSTEDAFNPVDYNFAAQFPTEKALNENFILNEPYIAQYRPMATTTRTYMKHNPSKKQSVMQDGGHQLPPKSMKSNVCESTLKLDSSQPQIPSLLNEHTGPSPRVPHPRNSSLMDTSPSNNSSRSRKQSLQHTSQSKNHSPEKKSRYSFHPSRSKKHSECLRISHSRSPLPQNVSPTNTTRHLRSSHSKSYSPVKRTSHSRSSRSNKHSPVKRNSCSPRSSKSKNTSPLRTSHSRSSRSKNRSPVKRTSRFSSSRSTSRTPSRKTSRLPSSRCRTRSPSRRVHRLHSSRSRSHSPLRRKRRTRSSQSKSCSPLKRTRRSHSSSSEGRSPLNKTSNIRSYRSKSRSPSRRTSRLHSSHSRSRSPRRRARHSRLSNSRSWSPSKRSRSKSSSPKANNSSQRSFAVRVDIRTRLADDKTLKEVIFQRFVKFGFVTSVEVHHSFCGDRYVLVFYDQRHELEEALIGAPKMRLYSKKIEVTPWTGRKVGDNCDVNMWEDEMTKFSPVSTRTLLIDNLPKTIAPEKLDNICVQFDDILDIEIKQEPEKHTCSAMVEFCSITSLIKTAKVLNKDFFGTSQVKVTFAKSSPTSCLWLDGLPTNLTLDSLILRFSEYGPVAKTFYDCLKGMALVFYKHEKDAVAAMKELKCGLSKISGNRVMVDFANDRTELAFCQAMVASGQNVADFLAH